MTDLTRIHDARGQIVLTATRRGREEDGLEAITAMRWRDESHQAGQDSHVRLALHVERGGRIFVQHNGEVLPVEVDADDRVLHTRGFDEAVDPILHLPTY